MKRKLFLTALTIGTVVVTTIPAWGYQWPPTPNSTFVVPRACTLNLLSGDITENLPAGGQVQIRHDSTNETVRVNFNRRSWIATLICG